MERCDSLWAGVAPMSEAALSRERGLWLQLSVMAAVKKAGNEVMFPEEAVLAEQGRLLADHLIGGVSPLPYPAADIFGGFPSVLVQEIALFEPARLTALSEANSMVILFPEPATLSAEHLPEIVRTLALPIMWTAPPWQSNVAV
jgi:hypothetical protein